MQSVPPTFPSEETRPALIPGPFNWQQTPLPDPPRRKPDRELRTFALVVAAPLSAIGGWLLWKGRPSGYVFLGAAGLLLALAAAAPGMLAPVERVWMKAAGVMSVVMTYVILTLTYFLVIAPVGLLVRLTGKDLLQLRWEKSRASYWEPVEPDGPATRPDKPF